MSNVERPDEMLVVSRREWMRLTALAGAASALPARALAAYASPQQCDPSQQPKQITPDVPVFDQVFKTFGPQNNEAGGEVAWGFIAAFLALVLRHGDPKENVDIDSALLPDATTDQQDDKNLPSVICEMRLDQTDLKNGGWTKVRDSIRDTPLSYAQFQALRDSAHGLWLSMASQFNPNYPSKPDVQMWQLRAISLLPQSKDFSETKMPKVTRGEAKS